MSRPLIPQILAVAALVAPLGACISERAETPAWFDDRAAELNALGTPELTNVPRGTDATLDPAHWAAVQADMAAAEAALKTNPRSAPLPPEGAGQEAFEAQARQEIEATRSNY